MTVKEFSLFFKSELQDVYDGPECNALVKLLLQERLQWSFSTITMNESQEMESSVENQLLKDLARLKTGEPVQHILGYAWFNELKLGVSKDVLIPRPETEELVSFIQDYSLPSGAVIIDVCTGSGCIALALKKHYPQALVFGTDVSTAALEVAEKNSRDLQLQVDFLRWDLLSEELPDRKLPKADVIVSNPPYVLMDEINSMHRNVAAFEPHIALFVPDNEPLMFYEIITRYASSNLLRGGRLWFEINKDYGEDVGNVLEKYGFSDIRIYRDISEHDRFVSGVR